MAFVDVPDPIEIMLAGFTDAVDTNIPLKLADHHLFIDEKKHFAMADGPNSADHIQKALFQKSPGKVLISGR
ncbi:hypothetical protein [Hydrocarboniclastica marina]|uniref:Uncharacterized protein n=1 Tax=Hydrocarboniclastica marina TaxID=2259620 RepID=A0A4P7XLD6_9ALTE|nr:hypothetical protein [Hydrocarboniclastica marina]QCF27202.1 hypothetical protein soil367_15395 [Hydrocarboniclastica marina]